MFNETQTNNISPSTNKINSTSSTMVNGNGANNNNNNNINAATTTISSGTSSSTGGNGRGSPIGNVVVTAGATAPTTATTPITNMSLRSNNDEQNPNINNSIITNSRSEY